MVETLLMDEIFMHRFTIILIDFESLLVESTIFILGPQRRLNAQLQIGVVVSRAYADSNLAKYGASRKPPSHQVTPSEVD